MKRKCGPPIRTIPRRQHFTVGDPKRRYGSMVRALQTLYRASPSPHYLAITCLISCYIDAVAARGGAASKTKFLRFVRNNFKQLCAGLDHEEPGLDGAEVFYKYFRSGMVHTFFSRDPKYSIAEDHELDGAYTGKLRAEDRPGVMTAVNVDRLYKDFVSLAKRKARQKRL